MTDLIVNFHVEINQKEMVERTCGAACACLSEEVLVAEQRTCQNFK